MLDKIVYRPENVGTITVDEKGREVRLRKYHMTTEESDRRKTVFQEMTKHTPNRIKRKDPPKFLQSLPAQRCLLWASPSVISTRSK